MTIDHDEAITMIKYFWEEKEDLERWCGWDEDKDEFPVIRDAWERYKSALLTLNMLIDVL